MGKELALVVDPSIFLEDELHDDETDHVANQTSSKESAVVGRFARQRRA